MAIPKKSRADFVTSRWARLEDPDLPEWARSDDPETFLRGYERLHRRNHLHAYERQQGHSIGDLGPPLTEDELAVLNRTRRKALGLQLAHEELARQIFRELIEEEGEGDEPND